jgi:CBS domain-containing protein
MRSYQIMKSAVQIVGETETIQTAATKMALANVGFLPVCDDSGKVVGTITDRDIVVRTCAAGSSPALATVREAMTHDVVSCRAADDLRVAERLMIHRQISRIVITDDEGTARGVISLSDIAEIEPPRLVARVVRDVAARETPRL